MDIRELKYVVEIGKTRNLTKAAGNLFITQPALSKTLKKLEKELGSQLFYREGNTIMPTDEGQILLEKSEVVFGAFDDMCQAVRDVQHLDAGRVRLGFPSVVGLLYLPQVLANFKNKFPGIELQIFVFGGAELIKNVVVNEIDVGFGMRPILCDTVNETPVIEDEVVIGMDASHPLAQKKYIRMEDLANVSYISLDSGYCLYAQLNERFRQANVVPTPHILGRECGLMMEFTRISNLVCIFPKPVLEYYAWPTMVYRSFIPKFTWELCIIYRKNVYISNAIKALMRYIQAHFLKID